MQKSYHCSTKSPFMGKTLFYDNNLSMSLYGKIFFLYKLAAVLENGCPNFTE